MEHNAVRNTSCNNQASILIEWSTGERSTCKPQGPVYVNEPNKMLFCPIVTVHHRILTATNMTDHLKDHLKDPTRYKKEENGYKLNLHY